MPVFILIFYETINFNESYELINDRPLQIKKKINVLCSDVRVTLGFIAT